MNYVETTGNTEGIWGLFFGTFIVIGILFLILFVAAIIVILVAKVKVFKKAGKSGWEAIIPFYSDWILCEITGVEKWFFALLIAPTVVTILDIKALSSLAVLAGLAGSFFCSYNLALKFKKDGIAYGLGLALLPIIFYPILGFGKSEFEDVPVSPYGPVTSSTAVKQTPSEPNKSEEVHEEPATETKAKKTPGKKCPSCGKAVGSAKFCSNCGEKIK